MKEEISNIEMLISEVHEYIQNNPSAADSVLGIAQCWLSKDTRIISLSELLVALERMENSGEITSIQILDGTRIWRKST